MMASNVVEISESELQRLLSARHLDHSDLDLVQAMAATLLSKLPHPDAAVEPAPVKGDRFANDNGQYVICGEKVYALMSDLKWHLRHGLNSRDRATLRLVERGFIIQPYQLASAK